MDLPFTRALYPPGGERLERTLQILGISKVLSYAFCVHVEIESFLHHGPVKVPTKFIVGDMDVMYNTPGVKDYIQNSGLKASVPNMEEHVNGGKLLFARRTHFFFFVILRS
jgi:hypothetical protein